MSDWHEHEAKAECLDLRQRVRELEAEFAAAEKENAELRQQSEIAEAAAIRTMDCYHARRDEIIKHAETIAELLAENERLREGIVAIRDLLEISVKALEE